MRSIFYIKNLYQRMNYSTPLRGSVTLDTLQPLLFTFLASLSTSYLIIKFALGYWKRRGILHDKPKNIWRHLKDVGCRRHLIEVLQNHYQKYQNHAVFVGFYLWVKPVILMIDLNNIERILIKNANIFTTNNLKTGSNDIIPEASLLLSNQLPFSSIIKTKQYYEENIENLLPATVQFGHRFCHNLQQKIGKPMRYNISQLVTDFFNDLFAELVLGLKLNSLQSRDTEFHTMAKAIASYSSLPKIALSISFPLASNLLNNYWLNNKSRNFIKQLLLQKRNELKSADASQACDYFQLLLLLQPVDEQCDGGTNEDALVKRITSFIYNNLYILSTTLSCCLLELAIQPEIQCRARSEIQGVLRKHQNQITNESLKEMIYLQQIINEALRKYPPYPFLLRAIQEDYELADSVLMLQRGNSVIIPIHAIHHDTRYYKHAHEFHPEHFHSSEVLGRPPAAFLPFGLGTTSEVLQQLATQQMSICLIVLLTKFSFMPTKTVFPPVEYDKSEAFLKPNNSIELQMTPI